MTQEIEQQNGLTVIDDGSIPFALSGRGSMTFIVDAAGKELSDGFHSFEVYGTNDEEGLVTVRTLLGVRGAGKYILSLPSQEDSMFRTVTDSYHEITYRFDLGMFVGSAGSGQFLLDESGNEVSSGHHEIFVEGGVIYGRLGAVTEVIRRKPIGLDEGNPELPSDKK